MIGRLPRPILSTARSVSRSTPTRVAGAARPSLSCTWICAARAITWKLVTMWPVHVVDDPGAEAALHAFAVVRPDVAEQLGELRRQAGDIPDHDAPLRIDVDDRGGGRVHRVRVAHELRRPAARPSRLRARRSRVCRRSRVAPTPTAQLPARASAAPRRAQPQGPVQPRAKSSATSPACPTSARRPPIVHVSPCIMRQSLQRTKIGR